MLKFEAIKRARNSISVEVSYNLINCKTCSGRGSKIIIELINHCLECSLSSIFCKTNQHQITL